MEEDFTRTRQRRKTNVVSTFSIISRDELARSSYLERRFQAQLVPVNNYMYQVCLVLSNESFGTYTRDSVRIIIDIL